MQYPWGRRRRCPALRGGWGRRAAGRRGRLSPASGRALGHSVAGMRESLLFLSGRHEERFLPELPETGGRGRSRRRCPWGQPVLHRRAHAPHTAQGSPRCHLLAGSAGAPRPPRRALPGPGPGPGGAARRGRAGRRGFPGAPQPMCHAASRGAAPFREGAAAEEHTPRRLTPPQTC